jgi:hypothetical protein
VKRAAAGLTGARLPLALALVALLMTVAAAAHAVDPLNTMRAFCQADGRGARVDPRTWPRIADLVSWSIEPAWDHLYLIRGFELGTPQLRDGGVEVEVQYTITADVQSSVVQETERVETRTYRLVRGDDGLWRIRAPAPPPYLFASSADASALAALLDPAGSTYLSNSAFAWRMLRDADWAIDYATVPALPTAPGFTVERSAQVGDLALYYDGDQPYHVGIVESDDTVVSATLNGGIRRTPFGSFAGEIRYLRPVAVSLAEEPTPTPPRPRPKRRRQ